MSKKFYKDGLRFECTRCHACCRHEPGFVFLSSGDLSRLSRSFGLSEAEFVERYCRRVDVGGFARISLREKPNYDCIFWDGGCTVYKSRPLQCRAYPFWAPVVSSEASWNEEKKHCPGIDLGKLHKERDIDRWLRRRESNPPLSSWPS